MGHASTESCEGHHLDHDVARKGVDSAVEDVGESQIPVVPAVDAEKRVAEVGLFWVQELNQRGPEHGPVDTYLTAFVRRRWRK